MDRLDALIAVAHLKLRLETLQRHPEYLEMATAPVIPAPIQLAGLKSRLTRAAALEKRAAAGGTRIDAALDVIETGVSALEAHAPALEQYGSELLDTITRLTEPSNGGPSMESAADAASPPGPNGGPRIHNSGS